MEKTVSVRTRLRRAVASSAALVAATGALVAFGPGPASFAASGTLTFDPPTGLDTSSVTLNTSGPCTDPNATNLIVTVSGAGFPNNTIVVGNSSIAAYPVNSNGGYGIPLTQTMQTYASRQSPPATLTGTYTFTVTCRTAFNPADLGDFGGAMRFTDPTHYTTQPDAVATTTGLTASPAGAQTQGQPVTLTATVSPTADGAVQFADNGNALGSPVSVSSGTAQLQVSNLAVGSHSLTAAFTPVDSAAFAPSASAPVSYTINAAGGGGGGGGGSPTPAWEPVLWGATRLGSTVLCLAAFDNADSVTYQWLSDGSPIGGATGWSYAIPDSQFGRRLSCQVTATNSAGSSSGTSTWTTVAAGPALHAVHGPSITGRAQAGKRLVAKVGGWSPKATSYSYQWRRNGRPIRGATRSSYVVGKGDRRAVITVTVVAHRAHWGNGAATSRGVRIAAK